MGFGSPRLRVGSSPRLRGTPGFSTPPLRQQGIIPALAGNTHTDSWSAATNGDHPRACGEHSTGTVLSWLSMGSSPRLRGTLWPNSVSSNMNGIIPALAGNTTMGTRRTAGCRDHPRACGEHAYTATRDMPASGSSPRLRGTQTVLKLADALKGIIPALAGNTSATFCPVGITWDHPRACGEHSPSRRPVVSSEGSSPRLRGTLQRFH